MSQFDYLIERIQNADFCDQPFKHIYVDDFFSPEHFEQITSTPEIGIPTAKNDDELFDSLFKAGYQIIAFPGCITDKVRYLHWHADKSRHIEKHSACEGFGVVVRLVEPKSEILNELDKFLASEAWNRALAAKYDLPFEECTSDTGIQKYLDGYEISPHPDVRKKALTFMVNINPHANAEEVEHHTHYLTMKDEYNYVRDFWQHNTDVERCWVPWEWCETKSMQTKNNSIVIFSPSNDTMHGVKAKYDHLGGQRTQLYGNLWYNTENQLLKREWEDLDIKHKTAQTERPVTLQRRIKRMIPTNIRLAVKKALGRNDNVFQREIEKK